MARAFVVEAGARTTMPVSNFIFEFHSYVTQIDSTLSLLPNGLFETGNGNGSFMALALEGHQCNPYDSNKQFVSPYNQSL